MVAMVRLRALGGASKLFELGLGRGTSRRYIEAGGGQSFRKSAPKRVPASCAPAR